MTAALPFIGNYPPASGHILYEKLQYFIKYGIYTNRLTIDETLPDPKDLVFYEVCMAKREEDSMLVTGNMKHFPSKPFIVTPNELLDIIRTNP